LYYATAAGQGIIDDVPSLNSKCSLYVNSHYVPHALRSTCKASPTRTAVAVATYVQGWKGRRSNPGRVKIFFTSPKRLLLISGRKVRIYIACYFQVIQCYCPIGYTQHY